MRAVIHGCLRGRTEKEIIAQDVQNGRALIRSKAGKRAAASHGDMEYSEQEEECVQIASLSGSRKRSGHFRALYRTAEEYWKHFKEMDYIATHDKTADGVPAESITEFVSFIFDPSNRQLL